MSDRRGSGRRYLIRFVLAMAAYCVLLIVAVTFAPSLPEDSPWRYVIVLLPVLAVAGIAWALWRYIVEVDELQSRMLLESLSLAVAGTVVTSFGYGMLELVGAPHLSWVWVTPLVAIWFGIGSMVSGRRYR